MQIVSKGQELTEIAKDVLEVLGKSLPWSAGVALGLVGLFLEYKDVRKNIEELQRKLLTTIVEFLALMEYSKIKLAAHSTIVDYEQCESALRAAILFCCGVKGSNWYGGSPLGQGRYCPGEPHPAFSILLLCSGLTFYFIFTSHAGRSKQPQRRWKMCWKSSGTSELRLA